MTKHTATTKVLDRATKVPQTKTGGSVADAVADMGERNETVSIPPPKFETMQFTLRGTAPYMQSRFSEKALEMMRAKQAAGSTAGSKKKRTARDFDGDYERAKHLSTDGWCGIPAGAFRSALISACRVVGFKMTLAKLSVFCQADGYDKVDGTPLVRIYGTPEKTEMPMRNDSGGADIRVRPMWREWSCKLRIRYDTDQFTRTDICNLLMRAGMQVGVGEGRPDSRNSHGTGFGLFESVPE